MSTDQTKPSEWAREKARKIHGDYQRAAWSMLAGSTIQEVEAARIDHLALALDAAIAERDEAIRVLAERLRYSEHLLACHRMNKRPNSAMLDDAIDAMDAVTANAIANAAVSAARRRE